MVAKLIPGYFSRLDSILEATDRALPVCEEKTILNLLNNDGDWTTLLIQDTVGYEVVKVINHRNTVVIDRGLSHTKPKRFPVGSCVTFTPSEELLKAIICATDCCENGEDTTFGEVIEAPNQVPVETLPNKVIGGYDTILGEPDGFMLINGKKVPYYE